ncbi:MAG: hypothetical protein Q9172_001844 [Xanthocarpia lactea]
MSSSTGPASTDVPTPAGDNLRSAINFRYKKPPPRNVIYFTPQLQAGQELQMRPQAPVAGAAQQQQQGAGVAPLPGISLWQAPGAFHALSQGHQQALQMQSPMTTFTDPVRYSTWGPKTVYYVDNLPDSHSSSSGRKKKRTKVGSRGAKKSKEKAPGIKFQRVILNGSEQMQTTERTEVLGPDQGGGIKKTWVCLTMTEVVSVEKEVEAKDVVVESDDEEGGSGSEETSDEDMEGETDTEEACRKQKVKKRKERERKRMLKMMEGAGLGKG